MAFALLALLLLAAGSRADLDWDLETRILDTVTDIVDIVTKQSYVLVDAYFGLTLAEAQIRLLLDWTWAQGAENCPIAEYIQITEEKLSKALQITEKMRETEGDLWAVIRPDLWEIRGQRRKLPLQNLVYVPLNVESADPTAFVMQGTPRGKDSDNCMTGLINNCSVSPRCWQAQTSSQPPARGYPLTHRLLFLLTARQLNCEHTPSFANFSIPGGIRYICERIMADFKSIVSLDYPSALRDLYTEEITLCGMDGFREFTNRESAERILSWKLPSGCFPSFSRRRKRNDYVIDNCSMHFSGLAAGALSVILRNMLEDTRLANCMKA